MPPMPAGGSSLGELYSKCVQMVNENKISAKNAFDLRLIEHMDDIVESFMGGRKTKSGGAASGRQSVSSNSGGEAEENRFHEASCTIEASAKIYACRVDCVHTDTYRVLGGLNSADMGDEDDTKDGEESKGGAAKKRRICGVNTLERNEASIIQQNLEADEQSDPTFRRMAAAFDAGGARGLLLSHLPTAEDLSLVFNGDIPLNRAHAAAQGMFATPRSFPSNELGLGDPKVACARFAEARLCVEVDRFRQQLVGNLPLNVGLPPQIDALLGPHGLQEARPAAGSSPAASCPPIEDFGAGDANTPFEVPGFDDGEAIPSPGSPGRPAASQRRTPALPLADAETSLVAVGSENRRKDDAIAFDALFQKFCSAGGSHQFAYFDECWSKSRDKDGKGGGALVDAKAGGQAADPVQRERAPKRPLFDLSGIDQPPKPIETEPAQKHQLSERATHWQLHKDVPPYMIDRITMPSWPTWSKCDFACLGLRPHLMLKLVRKPPPEGEGPHGFSDLFSTVLVENPEAFPWLAAEARAAQAAGRPDAQDDGSARAERDMEFADDGDDDFEGNGLPAHLDVDPADLFLRPDDKVLPGGAHEDLLEGGHDAGAGAGIDFDLVDQPAMVGSVDISYSRNSKFVDVKLVKKHLWDCINSDIEESKAACSKQAASSFQDLVNRTVRCMPRTETANLSVAVCFICALHLCNEKGLELNTDKGRPLGDFAVVGPP